MKVEYIYHSGFSIETDNYFLILITIRVTLT